MFLILVSFMVHKGERELASDLQIFSVQFSIFVICLSFVFQHFSVSSHLLFQKDPEAVCREYILIKMHGYIRVSELQELRVRVERH